MLQGTIFGVLRNKFANLQSKTTYKNNVFSKKGSPIMSTFYYLRREFYPQVLELKKSGFLRKSSQSYGQNKMPEL